MWTLEDSLAISQLSKMSFLQQLQSYLALDMSGW